MSISVASARSSSRPDLRRKAATLASPLRAEQPS